MTDGQLFPPRRHRRCSDLLFEQAPWPKPASLAHRHLTVHLRAGHSTASRADLNFTNAWREALFLLALARAAPIGRRLVAPPACRAFNVGLTSAALVLAPRDPERRSRKTHAAFAAIAKCSHGPRRAMSPRVPAKIACLSHCLGTKVSRVLLCNSWDCGGRYGGNVSTGHCYDGCCSCCGVVSQRPAFHRKAIVKLLRRACRCGCDLGGISIGPKLSRRLPTSRRWLLHAMTLEYFLTSSAQLCSVLL